NVLASRNRQLDSLDTTVFDVLVIGGGASGCGCALDAASRGLKTALLEASDFASGTSSKSSKLIHGGLRRLPSAIRRSDYSIIRDMNNTLQERALILKNATHLVTKVPMVMPLQSHVQLPRLWLILKLYDLLAGFSNLQSSHLLNAVQTHKAFPLLDMADVAGSLVSYELQMDDARFCLALAMTAARQGARLANYVQVKKLFPPDNHGIRTCLAKDLLTSRQLLVRCICVVNATGPNVDTVRRLVSDRTVAVARPAAGTHIVLPGYFARTHALHSLELDEPFVMPWQGHTLVGCTEGPLGLEPTRDEVELLLAKFRSKLRPDVQLNSRHVLSAWKGLWATSSMEEQLLVSGNGLIIISRGNWTNYRAMAEAAIDAAVMSCRLLVMCDCRTKRLHLEGRPGFSEQLPRELVHSFGVPLDVAQHLTHSYGCNAVKVLSAIDGGHKRLHDQFPHIEAEVYYAVKYEYALTAADVLARRLRVAFVDVGAALEILPRVVHIMSKLLGWNEQVRDAQIRSTIGFLQQEMGMGSV
ncbi:hypothetical protein KR009_005869, partial [Drosophila setifemur]